MSTLAEILTRPRPDTSQVPGTPPDALDKVVQEARDVFGIQDSGDGATRSHEAVEAERRQDQPKARNTPPPSNLPVPVLAEPTQKPSTKGITGSVGEAKGGSLERESTTNSNSLGSCKQDSRGGQNTLSGEADRTAVATAGKPRNVGPRQRETSELDGSPAQSLSSSEQPVLKAAAPVASLAVSQSNNSIASGAAAVESHLHDVAGNPAEAVRGPSLSGTLDEIVAFLSRYMRFEHAWQPDICALWAAYVWVYRSFARTPYLYIFAPEANCGKTQLMNCLYYLSPPEPHRWNVVAPTEASLFRKINRDHPVIFLDEIDTYFQRGYDDPIVGIINSGYKIGARVPRCIGKTGDLEEFEVFCPKCFTGIGKLPNTTATRSIHVHLTRQEAQDRVQPFRELEIAEEVRELTKFLLFWAKEHADALRKARPSVPDEITDGRKIEIIEPLLAVAEAAGPDWADRASYAAIAAFSQDLEAQSDKTRLLASIRAVFMTTGTQEMSTDKLLKLLVESADDEPWPQWWEKSLSQGQLRGPAMKLAGMLKDFGIHPRLVPGDERHKGYYRADMLESFRRYLPGEETLKQETGELGL